MASAIWDEGLGLIVYGPLAFISVLVCKRSFFPGKHDYPNIPAVGYDVPLLYYYSAIKYLFRGREMIEEGYAKYKGGAFKVPELFNWQVVISGHQLIEELRKADDDELNFDEATAENLQTIHTLGPRIHDDPYHVSVVRSRLTRSLGLIFSDVQDEVAAAFDDVLPPSDDWQTTTAYSTVMEIIARTSNRIFVGLPVCRDKDYIQLNVEFASSVMISAAILRVFPAFLRPFVARITSKLPQTINRALGYLEGTIKQRLDMVKEYGKDWPGKPNDLLSWLIDEARGNERDIRDLTVRILTLNFASIHTSSMSFAHALYHLAANPEFSEVMRKEVEQAVKQHGWTKEAMDKLPHLDSFLRESHRFNGLGGNTMFRRAMKDFTFSDGTLIPKGGFVSVIEQPMHHDPEHYENPDVFNPWRFVELRENFRNHVDDADHARPPRYGVVSTSAEYVTFGHGRHACPGRFFAASELKAMMAHLVITYDVKMEDEGVTPPPAWLGSRMFPSTTGKIVYRSRKSSLHHP